MLPIFAPHMYVPYPQEPVGRMVVAARAVGLAVGGAVSVPVGLAIATELYGVSGTDPVSLLLVAGLLLSAGVMAACIPARRAARVSPSNRVGEAAAVWPGR
jgi:hypothetical protein